MLISETFKALGHPNIRSTHKTTIMITRDAELTPRGDCIVAVKSDKGLGNLKPKLKEAIKRPNAIIRLIIEAGGLSFEVKGRGDPKLTLNHPTEMVARKSGYICERTLMIGADKAASDIDGVLVKLLKEPNQVIKVTISVNL